MSRSLNSRPASILRNRGLYLAALLAVVAGGLLSGFALAEALSSFGLRTTDASGCHLTDGRGFEASTIILMAGAYDKLSQESALALKVIDTAIASGCGIDEPDELGLSPLNAAILYNEPILVERFLQAGADPHRPISSPRRALDGLDSFGFLRLLQTKAPGQGRQEIGMLLDAQSKHR